MPSPAAGPPRVLAGRHPQRPPTGSRERTALGATDQQDKKLTAGRRVLLSVVGRAGPMGPSSPPPSLPPPWPLLPTQPPLTEFPPWSPDTVADWDTAAHVPAADLRSFANEPSTTASTPEMHAYADAT